MTATTYTHLPATEPGTSFGGKISRFFWRMIDAKQKHVQQRIANHFRGLDDEYLVRLGYTPSDIARVRRG